MCAVFFTACETRSFSTIDLVQFYGFLQVYPMYKVFIEPDLETAQIRIINKFNPFSGLQSPTYILKVEYQHFWYCCGNIQALSLLS